MVYKTSVQCGMSLRLPNTVHDYIPLRNICENILWQFFIINSFLDKNDKAKQTHRCSAAVCVNGITNISDILGN